MDNKRLLFFADFELTAQDMTLFDESYAIHMPKKLKVPGFLFGYRYLDINNPYRTICLYGIEDKSFLRSLFSKKISNRHTLLQEQSAFEPIYDFVRLEMGVYQLKSALPGEAEHWFGNVENLHFEFWDWKKGQENELLGHKFDHLYLNEILNLPSKQRAYRFERFQNAEIDYLNTGPKNIAIIESSPVPFEEPANLYRLKENKLPLIESRKLLDAKPFAKHWPAVKR